MSLNDTSQTSRETTGGTGSVLGDGSFSKPSFPVFVNRPTRRSDPDRFSGTNTVADWVTIPNTGVLTGANFDTFVEVTPNWGTNGVYDLHPVGVWYTGNNWAVFNENNAAMPFNVFAFPGTESVTSVPGSNAFFDYVLMNDPGLNNNPNAIIEVTPNWGPVGSMIRTRLGSGILGVSGPSFMKSGETTLHFSEMIQSQERRRCRSPLHSSS